MKKLMCIVLCLGLVLGFAACGTRVEGDYNVYMPDGATALSLAYMMENYETIDDATVSYNVVSPEVIKGYVINGSADLAILPLNLAVNLFKQGADYKIKAVMTHGNMFFIGKEAASLEDLEGSVVASIGQGAIPQLVLEYILSENDLTVEHGTEAKDGVVTINYFGDGADVIKALSQDKASFGFIAEPAATNATKALAAKGVKVLFNAQDEWKALTGEEGYPQAALVVKNGTDNAFVDEFVRLCKKGDGWAAESEDNAAKAVTTIKAHAMDGTESTMPSVTPDVIARCNIKTMTDGIEEYVESFLDAVGFAKPDNFREMFYYID